MRLSLMPGLAAAVLVSIATSAWAECTLPADVLPVAAPNAEPAPALRMGVAANGDATWMISGMIHRCVDSDSQSVEIAIPPEMGVTRTADVLLAISGVQLVPEVQRAYNKSTEWALNSLPTARVADPANTDSAKNTVVVSWDATFANVVSYQLSYTLVLTQSPH